MIEECNFKQKTPTSVQTEVWCRIAPDMVTSTFSIIPSECVGEDNCILYQIYKENYVVREIKTPGELETERMIRQSREIDDSDWGLEAKKKTTKEGTKMKGWGNLSEAEARERYTMITCARKEE